MLRKHVTTRRMTAMGLLGCLMLAFLPLGCMNSIAMAPVRYREQHPNARHLLRDITVERLQACVETHGDQLESDSSRVEATVQVDQYGRHFSLLVEGIPDSAKDFATCTETTLRDMALPMSVLQLRDEQMAGQKIPMGNYLANPIVAWEIAAAFAEFMAQHGGKAVLYSVTVEVLSAAAIAAVTVYVGKRTKTKKKKTCIEMLQDCLLTSTADLPGNHWRQSRCAACFEKCSNGSWPESIPLDDGGSCSYPGLVRQ